jgi:uncharacterized damage-inducible protein DinB
MEPNDLVHQYEIAGELLAQSIRGLTPEDMLCVPDPAAGVGLWSIQQVVIHLSDAEFAFADRMKRIIAQDDPVLQGWDENRFVANLFYDRQSAQDAADLVRLTRAQVSRILRAAGPAAMTRTGRHTERGPQTLAVVLRYAADHLEHHLKFIHRKRAGMGKEMW